MSITNEPRSSQPDQAPRDPDALLESPDLPEHITRAVSWLTYLLWRGTATSTSIRLATHFTLLAVVVAAAIFLNRPVSANTRSSARDLAAGTRNVVDQSASEIFTEHGLYVDSSVIARLADYHTTIPNRLRREIEIYTVQPGDTVQGIALAFGLQPETIMWSNPAVEDQPDLLSIGQQLVILPIDGVYHEVKAGDTLSQIAEKYKVDISAITSVPWNNLQPPDFAITPGMKLIVAGGTKPIVAKVVTSYTGPVPTGARGTGQFRWPIIGRITQDYWSGHRALDIATPPNSPVYAADGGYVSFVGWTDVGYGNLVRIDHGNGFETWYAHNNSFAVSLGERVEAGQIIAYSGSTGHSTGPHVHFEIRYLGAPQNPRIYLP